ncbi:hypothetical protein IKS_05355 [Bacillus cereus VDM062]|nr:hypothetical protein IKS_05355 [Bacillus cereus VDM062]
MIEDVKPTKSLKVRSDWGKEDLAVKQYDQGDLWFC